MRFALQQASRKGGRENNEDCVGHCRGGDCGVFVLADGMGGHPRGEVAARLAVEASLDLFEREAQPRLEQPARFLAAAADAAHRRLRDYAIDEALDDSPRTTWVACVVQDGTVRWGHSGDSRFYLVRAGAVVVRTRDHSYRERQDSLGIATLVDERLSRNVLYTCLGGPARPQVEIAGPLPLHPGDRLLLCSDGLWDHVPDEAIAARLADTPLGEAVPALADLALRRGGAHCDNVSMVVLEWEPPAADAVASVPPAGSFVRAIGTGRFASGAPGRAAALARRAWTRRAR